MKYNDMAETVFEAAKKAGLDIISVGKHRDYASLQHGFSTLSFHGKIITGRREGVGVMGTHDIKINCDDGDEGWVEQCLDILSSGRTVECGKGVGMRDICQRIHWQTVDYQLEHMADKLRDPEHFMLNPEYQREHVWTTDQREQFMGYLLENGRMPLIFLQDSGERVRTKSSTASSASLLV